MIRLCKQHLQAMHIHDREYRTGSPKWTIHINWQHMVHNHEPFHNSNAYIIKTCSSFLLYKNMCLLPGKLLQLAESSKVKQQRYMASYTYIDIMVMILYLFLCNISQETQIVGTVSDTLIIPLYLITNNVVFGSFLRWYLFIAKCIV